MTNLKDARRKGKIDQFIRERERNAPGDMEKLDAALKHPAQETGKSGPAASTPDSPDD